MLHRFLDYHPLRVVLPVHSQQLPYRLPLGEIHHLGVARVLPLRSLDLLPLQGNTHLMQEDLVELTYDRALHFLGELGRSDMFLAD